MKLYNFGTKLFAAALAAFSLASCQNESSLEEISNNNRRDVELTITATKGDVKTRTDLTLDAEQTKLIKTWNLEDKIHVCEEDGSYVGYLEVTELYKNDTQAAFKGVVRLLDKDGKHNLYFSTIGPEKDKTYTAKTSAKMPGLAYDFANQISSDEHALNNNDLMITNCEVEVVGHSAQFTDLTLRRQFAYGRFTLIYNKEPLEFSENTVVTIDTEKSDIQTYANVEFPDKVTPERKSALSVTTSDNDFYVTFVPGSEQSRIKFTVTVGGDVYEGYSNEYLIEKNDFFRKNEGGALPIYMENISAKTYKITYKCGFDYAPKGEASVEISTSGDVKASAYKSLELTEPVLYDFTGWKELKEDGSLDENLISEGDVLTFDEGQTTKTLVAQWETEKLTVIYTDGVENEEVFTDDIHYGLSIGENNTPNFRGSTERDGYTFNGWSPTINPDIKLDDFGGPGQPNGVHYYMATWGIIKTPVGFQYEDGNGNITEKDTAEVTIKNSSVTKTVKAGPEKSGYKFSHWVVKDGATIYKPGTAVTFTKDTGVIVLVPVWSQDKVTVSSSDFDTMDIFGNN